MSTRRRTACLILACSLSLTACADAPPVRIETRVPHVDANLLAPEPVPVLAEGPASWTDLLLLAQRLRAGLETCNAKLGGIASVLEAAGMTPEEREADARAK